MDKPLRPGEVAALLRVDRSTIARWAKAGKIPSFQTPGGHRRYCKSDIRALTDTRQPDPTEEDDRD